MEPLDIVPSGHQSLLSLPYFWTHCKHTSVWPWLLPQFRPTAMGQAYHGLKLCTRISVLCTGFSPQDPHCCCSMGRQLTRAPIRENSDDFESELLSSCCCSSCWTVYDRKHFPEPGDTAHVCPAMMCCFYPREK